MLTCKTNKQTKLKTLSCVVVTWAKKFTQKMWGEFLPKKNVTIPQPKTRQGAEVEGGPPTAEHKQRAERGAFRGRSRVLGACMGPATRSCFSAEERLFRQKCDVDSLPEHAGFAPFQCHSPCPQRSDGARPLPPRREQRAHRADGGVRRAPPPSPTVTPRNDRDSRAFPAHHAPPATPGRRLQHLLLLRRT